MRVSGIKACIFLVRYLDRYIDYHKQPFHLIKRGLIEAVRADRRPCAHHTSYQETYPLASVHEVAATSFYPLLREATARVGGWM